MLHLILIVAGLILFALATFGWPASRFNLVAAGLFCWMLASSLGEIHA